MYNIQNEHYNYDVSEKGKATPYFKAYLSATNERPFYEEPVVPVVVDNRKEPKRTFFVLMVAILSLLIVAVVGLSFMGIMPEYTALFGQQTDEIVGEEYDEPADEIVAEAATAEDVTDGSETDTETEEESVEYVYAKISADDIINSTLKMLGIIETEEELVFYSECLANIELVETTALIAYYALPAAIALTAIIALYIFIKSIFALFSAKRRKFSYISLLLLLVSLLGIVAGLVWNAEPLSSVLSFFMMSGTNLVLGLGYIIVIVLEILLLICSMFAYRSKKKAKY
ncbi:MAG: hypothetical protein R3Y23_00450 [Bacillota bacterium]